GSFPQCPGSDDNPITPGRETGYRACQGPDPAIPAIRCQALRSARPDPSIAGYRDMHHGLGRYTMEVLAVKAKQTSGRSDPQKAIGAARDTGNRGPQPLRSKCANELTGIHRTGQCNARLIRTGSPAGEDQNRLRPSRFFSHSDANSQSLRT